jgi:N-hydroxyarylamine O-acetyltransferase
MGMEKSLASEAGWLDTYFRRIGHQGPRAPTLDTLRALLVSQPAAIPFEAIDVLLGKGVDLSPATVDAKLITAHRGGYCFEHNSLLKRVLLALGFRVEGLVARVRWMAPPDRVMRRTHMALRVWVDGVPWLADSGFGGCVPTAPLRFDLAGPQPTPHGDFRLAPSEEGFLLQAWLGREWAPVYDMSREAQQDCDYDVANWFTSTHPSSVFRRDLMVAITAPQARHALIRNRYTVRWNDGRVQREFLDGPGIAAVLARVFGLDVRDEWRPVIEAAAACPRDEGQP